MIGLRSYGGGTTGPREATGGGFALRFSYQRVKKMRDNHKGMNCSLSLSLKNQKNV